MTWRVFQSIGICIVTCLAALLVSRSTVAAQEVRYEVGVVVRELERQTVERAPQALYFQRVLVETDDGQEHEVAVGSEFQPITTNQLLAPGDSVVLGAQDFGQDASSSDVDWIVADRYRLPVLWGLGVLFAVFVVMVSGKQGVYSLLGSALSVVVLMQYVAPQLLSGANPIGVSVVAALIISIGTIYLTHGWRLKSHVSLVSMMIALGLTAALGHTAIGLGSLVGLGSEEAYFLQFSADIALNLQGIFLAGVVLGALGVLDDSVVAQVSVVFELFRANRKLGLSELYARALRVGKDHVSSLVNTLILAYAGANLPLFLLFWANETAPGWVTLNSQVVAEEAIRTLVGSIGLVVAVPIATLLAALVAVRFGVDQADSNGHTHVHTHS